MGNSYSGDPAGSSADAVRFHLGDTDPEPGMYLFEDTEVAYALGAEDSDIYRATAYLAMVMATRMANKRDRSIGPLSIRYGEQYRRWVEVSEKFTKLADHGGLSQRPVSASVELLGGGELHLPLDDSPHTYEDGEEASFD